MTTFRRDPGACPICGAAHTTCTGDTSADLLVTQLSQRDAQVARALDVEELPDVLAGPTVGDEFTTATYRRPPGVRR